MSGHCLVPILNIRMNDFTGGEPNPPPGSSSGSSKSNMGAIIGGAVRIRCSNSLTARLVVVWVALRF